MEVDHSVDQRTLDKERAVLLVDEKSKSLKIFCPLCRYVFQDPYVSSCGHTYCRGCIATSSGNATCPLDNCELSPVVRNIAVAEQVGEVLVYCRYGCKPHPTIQGEVVLDTSGCGEILKISEKEEHETSCQYAPVPCPNSSICGLVLRKNLSVHLQDCQHIRCPHNKFGCDFEGTKDMLENHFRTCKFDGVKGYLHQLDGTVSRLAAEVESKNHQIEEQAVAMADLRNRLEGSESKMIVTSKRIEHIEKQQAELIKELSQANTKISLCLSELKHVEQQLGLAGPVIEPQHLFKCQGTFVGHKGPVWSLCADGDLLFTASSDNTIKVWNISATYGSPQTLTGHDGIVLALCAKDHCLYSGGSDKTIKVWSIKELRMSTTFIAHEDPVCSLAASGSMLFSGSLRSIKVWDLTTHELLKTLPSQNHWVRALVAYDGYLYSGSYQAVKVWSLETLEVAHVVQCSGGSVYSLAVTSKHIICGTYENMIHVWDMQTLEEVGSLSGHVGTVYALCVLPTAGQFRLFSGSYDKTIRVWNLELMTCSQTANRHEGSVTCLTYSRGRVYSAAVDTTIKVWQ